MQLRITNALDDTHSLIDGSTTGSQFVCDNHWFRFHPLDTFGFFSTNSHTLVIITRTWSHTSRPITNHSLDYATLSVVSRNHKHRNESVYQLQINLIICTGEERVDVMPRPTMHIDWSGDENLVLNVVVASQHHLTWLDHMKVSNNTIRCDRYTTCIVIAQVTLPSGSEQSSRPLAAGWLTGMWGRQRRHQHTEHWVSIGEERHASMKMISRWSAAPALPPIDLLCWSNSRWPRVRRSVVQVSHWAEF